MRKTIATASAVTGAVGLAWLAARPLSRSIGATITRAAGGGPGHEWLKVTINCPPGRLSPPDGELPGPVARLADRAEVSIVPAPGDRGTELGLRLNP